MNINATFIGEMIVVFAIVMAILGYYLGKNKTRTPKLTALVGFLTAFIPPIAVLFLIVLVVKNDVCADRSKAH